jgi:S1-C subfamily serine protease
MSNKTLTAIALICVIAIAFSGLNSYLIINNFRIQQEQLTELKNSVDETNNRIGTVESALSSLNNRINALNQSISGNVTDLKTAIRTLNSSFTNLAFNVSNLEGTIDHILQQTPANIYETAHKSVVVITTPRVQGSGFLYSPNIILTNWHVVRNETDIQVKFYDGAERKASVTGTDAYSDVAVLTVSSTPPDAKPLQLGNSSKLGVGRTAWHP